LNISCGTILIAEDIGAAQPQLVLRRNDGPVIECLTDIIPPSRAVGCLHVAVPGGCTQLHPPLDVLNQEQRSVSPIPNASVTVERRVSNSPVGDIRFCEIFTHGRLERRNLELGRNPDVLIETNFQGMIDLINPQVPFLEAVRGAQVHCTNLSLLFVVAGLYESVELRSHLGRRREENELLCRLAQHTRTGAWKNAISRAGPA
ncbi:MAG: hypothetical protein H0U83_07155, partial [Sphingomonas sp.]|nr:hypothetical protein [Sphingomonas sp.]